MPNKMPDCLSGIMRDDTLTPGERLHLMEALFVHDSVGQWREERVEATRVAQATRLAPRAGSARGRPRGSTRISGR